MVGKPDGSQRFCIDFRAVNKVTKIWTYQLPHIDDLLASLSGAKYFTSLDLRAAYWQLPLKEESKPKTAFICDFGLFEFNRMPFGLTCAPAAFSELMAKVLDGLNFVKIYLDDVLVYSSTPEQHLEHLQQVFDRLRKHKLRLKKKKCKFFCKEMKYLGYIINESGILPDPEKVKILKTLPSPKTVRDVRSVLGMCSYYRRFIKWYSEIALPLTNLTKKSCKFVWTQECEQAFRKLIDLLSNSPVLAHPRTDLPFVLYTDASKTCVGAVLAQVFPEGERPIHFLSHKLSDTQRKWPPVQSEAYAIYYAVQKFRPYLYGAKVIVRTDHRPLTTLFTAELQNPTIQKWAVYLGEYNITVEHIAGKDNVCSDYLSRINWQTNSKTEPEDVVNAVNYDVCVSCANAIVGQDLDGLHETHGVHAINLDQIGVRSPDQSLVSKYVSLFDNKESSGTLNNPEEVQHSFELDHQTLSKEQLNDPDQYSIIAELKQDVVSPGVSARYMLVRDLLYYVPRGDNTGLRLMVPLSLQKVVLRAYHEELAHLASQRCYEMISSRYHWKNIYKDVMTHCLVNCKVCFEANMKQDIVPLQETLRPSMPWQVISLDLVGPFKTSFTGNNYIVTFIDLFTAWPEAYAVPSKDAEVIANVFLEHVWPRWGSPLIAVSDRGTEVCNCVCNLVFRHFGVPSIQ